MGFLGPRMRPWGAAGAFACGGPAAKEYTLSPSGDESTGRRDGMGLAGLLRRWGGEQAPLGLLAATALGLALLELGGVHLLGGFEGAMGDLLLRLHAAGRQADPDIVIVDIDESTLERMAPLYGRYPWPRSVHAELVEGMAAQGPRAIVFDVLFSDPLIDHPDGDQYFAEVVDAQPSVYLAMLPLRGGNDAAGVKLAQFGPTLGFTPSPRARPDARTALQLPYPALAATGRLGSIRFNEDPDGVGRRYDLYVEAGGWRIPSLPAKVAAGLGFPIPPARDMMLNWCGRALSYRRISYYDLYSDLTRQHRRRPAGELRDKIIIIGGTATGLGDLRATPIDSLQPAVEIVATAIDNLKHGDYLQAAPRRVPFGLTLLLIGGLWRAFRRAANPLPIGLGLALATPLAAGGAYLGLAARWSVPVFTPLLLAWLYYVSAALWAYLRERRTRERSVQIFSRFLDPRVVHDLVARGETMLSLSGQSRRLTVLFSDIRGFTTLSERSTPESIVTLLNDYFERQVRVIFHNSGTMDKFIGDAIMAFWGAPVDDPDQAIHAVEAALQMCDTLEDFRRDLGPEGAAFDVGIGIHTGPAVVGFLGSRNRLDYTAIGDTVNLASRIEGQTKGVARVLVSADTRELCGDAFEFVDRGFYKVKGRTQEVRLLEPRRKTV